MGQRWRFDGSDDQAVESAGGSGASSTTIDLCVRAGMYAWYLIHQHMVILETWDISDPLVMEGQEAQNKCLIQKEDAIS